MSASSSNLPYPKPWLSYADQVKLLEQRGLIVADAPLAQGFLSHLNYYRFSGYCLAFETSRHLFIPNTTFENVVAAYHFDLGLRDLLTEALEVIEVDIRAILAYTFGGRHGAFGHTDGNKFVSSFQHGYWLQSLKKEAKRSSELFVKHFDATYLEFPNLPIWIATEVMSFGCLSKMIEGMQRPDQKAISHRYGLQPINFVSVTHHLAYVRNLCAHHSRLWDREWAIKPTLPAGKHWQLPYLPSNSRLHCTLLLLRSMMKRVPAIDAFASNWRDRVANHLANPPAAPNAALRMDLTTDWQQNSIWI
jgi:abortive infection bacteriophage resistance protein